MADAIQLRSRPAGASPSALIWAAIASMTAWSAALGSSSPPPHAEASSVSAISAPNNVARFFFILLIRLAQFVARTISLRCRLTRVKVVGADPELVVIGHHP